MFLDVYINGQKRSTIAASNEAETRQIIKGMPEAKEVYFLPAGEDIESIKGKLQGVQTLKTQPAPAATKPAAKTAKTKTA